MPAEKTSASGSGDAHGGAPAGGDTLPSAESLRSAQALQSAETSLTAEMLASAKPAPNAEAEPSAGTLHSEEPVSSAEVSRLPSAEAYHRALYAPMLRWVRGVIDGTVPPTLRSEEPPLDNLAPVRLTT